MAKAALGPQEPAMTVTTVPQSSRLGLYPPTVRGAERPLPLHKFLFRIVRNPLLGLPQSIYQESIVVRETGRAAMVWVADPALIETILLHEADRFPKTEMEKRVFNGFLGDGILTSQGASWRWQRRTAAPLFRPADLTGLVPAMSAAAEAQLARWGGAPTGPRTGPVTGPVTGQVQAIDRDMTETTFRVISATMFAGSADAEAAEILEAGDRALATISWEIAAALLHFPDWLWYPGKHGRRRAGARLRSAVATILARRRAAGLEGDDLLARLARAKDPETGAPMSEQQLVDNLVTFLAAGHETTAKALTWVLYLLARAPDWQQRVRDEVLLVAGREPVDAGHLDKLVVTRAVLEEAMRLYPPAPVISRRAASAIDLGGKTIPEGAHVVIPIFALQRHRRLWDDPDRFDPERFMPERRTKIARTQFMPFGFGQRTCIGASFAIMEGVAILATLIRGAEFEWDGRHLPEPLSRVTLRPKGGMPLRVRLLEPAQHG
jgi:cytochrome P450